MPVIIHQGKRIHYEASGAGPALLLLHAFPLSARTFDAQRKALADICQVITPNLRGMGQSDAVPGPALLHDLAQDNFALLDALGIERAVVGGVSWGGYVAMAMLREDPTRVAGLILMNTHARADDAEGRAGRERTAHQVFEKGMEVLVESLLPRLLAPTAAPELRERVAAEIRRNNPAGAASALLGMAERPDARELLSRYAGSALVVAGETDAIVPLERSEELASLLRCELATFPSGHLTHLECSEALNTRLREFLSGLAASFHAEASG
ncbi:MAG: alpha/beta fold hydrolase [Myxococcaceae bacterium]